jgi:deoxyribose-phosphate aldolase
MNPAEVEALVEQITAEIHTRLSSPVRAQKDQVCSDCTGTCARRCAFKMEDFISAGAARIGGAPGLGKPRSGVAAMIDHTLLKPEATEADIDRLCAEASEHHFASVCVNPVFVERCHRRLEGTGVIACTVIGFPLGATLKEIKAEEARRTQDLGAQELDMVIPIGLLKSGRHDLVEEHVAAVTAVRRPGNAVKVIIETCLLTDAEKRTACRIAAKAGADYVKTSTGFAGGGATAADVALMREVVGPSVGVKASGGVKDYQTFKELVEAGATRIGASAGVKIVREASG